ncbi:MAG: PIG-L family deacetylase [Chloroflexi bacterium]|nr:PIG-L family deacetylase [Chloroflexota bacterium]
MVSGRRSAVRSEVSGVLIFGAHPDDADFSAGGVAALFAECGCRVKLVSLTNGDAGHFEMGGAPLAWRRRREAAASGTVLGCEYVTLDTHDGELLPTLELRREVIGLIREFKPDVVMTPRPWDYHPDHRYTAQVVQDALYMVTVPNVVSRAPHLDANPVVLYVHDGFQRPYPFVADVVADIGSVVERKVDALHCHTSQVYEWLPYNRGELDTVPLGEDDRRAWLRQTLEPRLRRAADLYRDRLIALYGDVHGSEVVYAEAFEICEYGAPLADADIPRLFPFFDGVGG